MDLFLYYYSFDWYEVTQTTVFRLLLLISLLTHRRLYLRDYTAELSVENNSANFISGGKSILSIYFIGIDISKYKHDCCIISASSLKVVSKFTIKNNMSGFDELLANISSLPDKESIKIGFESTSHYALNLELFLEKSLLTFMEVNPVLIAEYKKSTSLRRTKTDSVDCESIARWLMTVEYKPHHRGFYHTYSLKSLTRLRDKLVRQRSFYLVKLTNVLDHTFPEFKPFFGEKLSKTALYLLENYGSAEKCLE